jgi:hypothetical protein
LLDRYTARTYIAEWRIARSTQSLLEVQAQLLTIVARAERGELPDSDKLQQMVHEARKAMAISPEQLVAAVRDGSYGQRKDDREARARLDTEEREG